MTAMEITDIISQQMHFEQEEVAYGNGRSFDDFMAARGKHADWKAIGWKAKL